jgi:hypothetical protein
VSLHVCVYVNVCVCECVCVCVCVCVCECVCAKRSSLTHAAAVMNNNTCQTVMMQPSTGYFRAYSRFFYP